MASIRTRSGGARDAPQYPDRAGAEVRGRHGTGKRRMSRQKHRGDAMKRMHGPVAVDDLQRSIGFYSALFASAPTVVKRDYAKWMLDDPRVNFAISTRGRAPGLDHLGIQVENREELTEVHARLHEAGGAVVEQGQTNC